MASRPCTDANVGRFVRMLNQFKSRTQFIVITHNPRTTTDTLARRLATKQETAQHLRCGLRTVERMIAAGEIRAYRIHNRGIRIDLNEVDANLPAVRTIGAA